LAGLRVGFAFANPILIEALERIKNSFNSYPLDRLAIAGAIAAIEDQDYFARIRDRVIETRTRAIEALSELDFAVLPSQTNFIFVTHPRSGAAEIAHALRERSIVVRHFNHPRTENYLRITIGTDREIDALIFALKEILPS
jgi:histidinol-phosphate aminotransferase